MKKFVTMATIALLASQVQASGKCRQSTTACKTNHVTYVTTAVVHPAAPVHAVVAAKSDIVDTAVAAGSFNTLVASVKAAGLVDTLKGAGPFTVFAPTDAAFAKLPAGTVETLLKPENKALLQSILTYHVVSGKVMAAEPHEAERPAVGRLIYSISHSLKYYSATLLNSI